MLSLKFQPGDRVVLNDKENLPALRGKEAVVLRSYFENGREYARIQLDNGERRTRYAFKLDAVDNASAFVPEDWS